MSPQVSLVVSRIRCEEDRGMARMGVGKLYIHEFAFNVSKCYFSFGGGL